MNYTKLIKLLYLADRQSLTDVGAPITGAEARNMQHGPVLSEILDCVRYPELCPIWSGFIRKSGYDVELIADPGDTELSDYDVDTLTELQRKFASYGYGQMIDYVHKLPEWIDPGNGSSSELESTEILRAAKVEDQTIREYEKANEYLNSVDAFFAAVG